MNTDSIRHRMKINYGLPPEGPSDHEFKWIILHLKVVKRNTGTITQEDVDNAVYAHCDGVGSHKYMSQSHADLRKALEDLINSLD